MGQGRAPLEIVCADLGSTDGTRHIVSQFPTARFVDVAEPAGPRSWNRAMEETRGEVVAFLAQDGLPVNGDWLSHLVAPLDDASVGGVYGPQEVAFGGDPVAGFRLAQRFCHEPHWRRIRVGDRVAYKSLPFFIENAAVRRSVWRGIHFNEHLPVGADRVWARQVVLASYTIAYSPDAVIARDVVAGFKAAYREAVLTGFTDQNYGDEGGTLWPDSRHFVKRAAWYLLKGFAWGELPYLALEDALRRYGYMLGRRLDRMSPRLRVRFAPEAVRAERPVAIDDWAA
jgi:cellulose synthase/poly-beta-1,6-N-acetylglucosamine synthase-like glycosyltransferase